MEFRKRIHPHYYYQGILVSAKDKQKLNLLIIQKLQSLLNEIREKKPYVELYWYSLKYFVHSTHAIYRLFFYKILKIYGTFGMASKCAYHNLIYEPRLIEENRRIFNELVGAIDIQLCLIYSLLQFSLNI